MNLEEKTANNIGNNSGSRQGGGTPNSGNMSTPSRQNVVRGGARQGSGVNSQAAINRIRRQDRNGGNPQSQNAPVLQSQERNFEGYASVEEEDSDRGQDRDESQVNRGRAQNYNNLGNQRQVPVEQK